MNSRRNVGAMMADSSLFRAVVDAGLEPFVLSYAQTHLMRRSRYYAGGAVVANPDVDPEQFIEDLVRVGERFAHTPPLFFTHDAVLRMVSQNRDRLRQRYRFLMPPHATIEALLHKTEFATFARSHGLPVPASLRSDEIDDPVDALETVGLPCVLKPESRVTGWHDSPLLLKLGMPFGKVLRADTRVDFLRMYDLMRQVTPAFVVQTYVQGADDCIYSYHAYLDEASLPLVQFAGRKVRTFPKDSGISTCLELVHDAEILMLGRAIALRIGLVGPVKFDFKRDVATGMDYLLEINARCTLWNHLGVFAGANLPLAAWKHLNGLPVEPQPPYRTEFRWIAPANDLRAFRHSYRPAGDLTWAAYLATLRGPRIYDLFAWDDPFPALIRVSRRSGGRLKRFALAAARSLRRAEAG